MIAIDKGIPAPVCRNRWNPKYPWAGMEVGDSFLADDGTDLGSLRSQASRVGKLAGKSFAVRNTDAGLRV